MFTWFKVLYFMLSQTRFFPVQMCYNIRSAWPSWGKKGGGVLPE